MLFLLLCVILILPSAFASIDTTCLPSEEVDALRVIGRTLGKDWDFSKDPCVEWVASNTGSRPRGYDDTVLCNNGSNGTICHITSVSLKSQSLAGTLPPEFSNLPYLLNIDLARNYLSGTIPPEWGSMGQILNISLLGNRLTGSIPKELGNISTLTTLTVEDNLMSGTIPDELGNLASIERLFFNSNFFTGELPASFVKLTTVKEFRVGDNNFSGKIPDFIGQWRSLQSLRIQASGLEGPIPSNITLLEYLTDLRISDLGGPDSLCPPFRNTAIFENLILRSCNLIGQLPQSLPRVDNVLDFSFNKLSGSIPDRFIDLKDTDHMYLTGNSLSGIVPNWMTTSGDNIDLSYNNFTFDISGDSNCQIRETNLFASFSQDEISGKVSCLRNTVCPTNVITSLYINCGGERLRDGKEDYERDREPGGASYFSVVDSRWAFSNTGNFLDDNNRDSYIVNSPSMNTSELYKSARTSALSLTYYGFCMHNGSYNVSLHFAEIIFTDDETYGSLGRRVFDIYIQITN